MLLGILALFLVLLALYVSLGRELLPLVGGYREALEQRLSNELAMPVRIGRLEGGWQGVSPVLVAYQVEVGESSAPLRAERLSIRPDVASSLWQRSVRIADISLAGVELGLVEESQGHWRVSGLPEREGPAPDIPALLEHLQRIAQLTVTDSRVLLQPWQQPELRLDALQAVLQQSGHDQRLDLRLQLPDGQPLSAQFKAHVEPARWQQAGLHVYASLPQSDWAPWLPPALLGDWHLQGLEGGGDLWLEWQPERRRAVTRLNLKRLALQHVQGEPAVFEDAEFNAFAEWHDDAWSVQLRDVAMTHAGVRWRPVQWQVKGLPGGQRFTVMADRLDLQPLAGLARQLLPLPVQAEQWLEGLSPRGMLRNLKLQVQPGAPLAERVSYVANLDQVGVSPWHGVPGLENVSGHVQGNLEAGSLGFDSPDFSMHLDHLFPQAWHYSRARGRLNWHLDEQAFTLAGPLLQVEGEEGQLTGDMLLRLRRDPAEEDYLDLRVALRNGDARFTERYLPTLSPGLSQPLAKWLQEAIKGGQVEEGFFQYQGAVNRGAPAISRVIDLYFRVREAELAFQPGWPALTDARGEIFVENGRLRVDVPEARILDSQIRDTQVSMARPQAGQVPRLHIEGQVDSSLGDALKLLQEAPLPTRQLFAGWQGQGALQGQLTLDIPLGKGQPGVVAAFATEQASLDIAQANLGLSALRGQFSYDLQKGLSSPGFSARVLGQAVRGSAQALGSQGVPHSRIEASGRVAVANLQRWLGGGQHPQPAAGMLPYQLQLDIVGNDSRLLVDSSLEGVSVDLPAPFGKVAAAALPSRFEMTLGGAEHRYWIDYGRVARLNFAATPGDLSGGRGELYLGGDPALLPDSPGLWVGGRLPLVDLQAWQHALQPYLSGAAKASAPGLASMFKAGRLRLARVEAGSLQLDETQVALGRDEAGWSVQVDSQRLAGQLHIPDAAGSPYRLDLQHLRLPRSERAAEQPAADTDALAGIDPTRLPAADIHIEQLWWGDEALGSWTLSMQPTRHGVRFSNVDLDLKGLALKGDLGWENTRQGQRRTWYKGRLSGGNLGDVLAAWGFAPSVTSQAFRLDVDGRWPGSPAAFALKRYSGHLDGRMNSGQFVEVQGSASALRVFGLLNFNSIGRRLRLDFSDLFAKGLSYDSAKARLAVDRGVFSTQEPVLVEGPSSRLELSGALNMVDDRLDAQLLVTLPVTNNLPLAALIAGAPAIGGALFIADRLLGDKVARFASVQYGVSGSWQNPDITFEKPFEKPHE